MENKEIEKINEDLGYLFDKINWGDSFLDAKAVCILNEIRGRISKLGEK